MYLLLASFKFSIVGISAVNNGNVVGVPEVVTSTEANGERDRDISDDFLAKSASDGSNHCN